MKIRKWIVIGAAIEASYLIMRFVAAEENKKEKNIDCDNPYKKENAAQEDTTERHPNIYERVIKRGFDSVLSFIALILLIPLFLILGIAVMIDDPGPPYFSQKRVGKEKQFFYIHKFRTMKMDTPGDIPTHQLSAPEQYITRVGKILRRTSLDELPQMWDIFRGKMSIVGPRPALWNQKDLVEERDRYSANDIRPGLTGWAQINGRDELGIQDKARLDGEYVGSLERDGFHAFLQDCHCFFATVVSVLKSDGIVEGGVELCKGGDRL